MPLDLLYVTRSKIVCGDAGVGRYYSGPDDQEICFVSVCGPKNRFASADCEMTGRVDLGPESQA